MIQLHILIFISQIIMNSQMKAPFAGRMKFQNKQFSLWEAFDYDDDSVNEGART